MTQENNDKAVFEGQAHRVPSIEGDEFTTFGLAGYTQGREVEETPLKTEVQVNPGQSQSPSRRKKKFLLPGENPRDGYFVS